MENSLTIPHAELVLDIDTTTLNPHNIFTNNHKRSLDNNQDNDHNHDHDQNEEEYDTDIEMVVLDSKSYTSLKDIISDSPPATASPTNGSSWKEIPIKDPLVQHAAWAYLQPMHEAAAREEDGRWWTRLGKKCCGCFNDVVLVMLQGWFRNDDDQEKHQSVGEKVE